MKKTIYLLVFFINYISFSQEYNSIKYSELFINTISINSSKNQFITGLNLINTNSIYIDEIANEENEKFIQDNASSLIKSEFYFKDNKLTGFELLDNNFYINNINLKVGNSISLIESLYPLSFTNRSIINNVGFICILLKKEDNSLSDEKIIINYNSTTDKIISIHITS